MRRRCMKIVWIAWALMHFANRRRDDCSPGSPLCDDALATYRFRASGRKHSVQDLRANRSLGLLGSEAASSSRGPISDL
jgi:hypothetical protein